MTGCQTAVNLGISVLRVLLAPVTLLLVLVAAGCGPRVAQSPASPATASPLGGAATGPSASGPLPGASTTVIAVTLRDFAIEPRVFKARPGPVRFQVTNRGTVDHDFHMPALEPHHRHEQHLMKPGQTKVFDYTVKTGAYHVLCTIPGHREAGMTGTLEASP